MAMTTSRLFKFEISEIWNFVLNLNRYDLMYTYIRPILGWHESRYKCGALRIRRYFIEELWEQSSLLPEDEWRALARQRLVR